MMTSRTFSTWVWVAASISSTSMSRPSKISTQAAQVPQGSGVGPFSAIQCSGKNARSRRFADSSGTGKDEGLRQAVLRDGVPQRLGHPTLTNDVIKTLRSVLPGENLIRHGRSASSTSYTVRAAGPTATRMSLRHISVTT